MIYVSFIYSEKSGAKFDEDYYLKTHIPRVRELWNSRGLISITPLVRLKDDGSSGPLRAISMLKFSSEADYKNALANGGAELIADIKNFTDIEPSAQLSREI
jgi:uncharacterized protein (TIGR02118 family)